MVLAGGAAGLRRAGGTVDANNVWSGFGAFTFTAPDGTLFGRSTSRAQLPTTGVPYRLDIDGGTGAFAGTTGACMVEEHLQQQRFGVQDHSGAFTCDVSASGPSTVGS